MYEFQLICQEQTKQSQYAAMLSQWAKTELLKEKVKQKMNAKYGRQLDSLADLIVEIAEEQNKIQTKKEEIENAFDDSSSWKT